MPELLKNIYNEKFFQEFTYAVKSVYDDFDIKNFMGNIYTDKWDSLELKQRMRHITHTLGTSLPKDYPKALKILMEVTKNYRDFKKNGLTDIFFSDFTEVYGLDNPELSISALELFTQYSSAEFAIRPFIIKYPDKIMSKMLEWSKHENHHVRRLSSEGCRPRLPWAIALPEFKKNPAPVMPILENLKEDSSEYVRRSVANNLNDISKDHPEFLLKTVSEWYGKNADTDKIVKHACRGLLKKGNNVALSLFGFEQKIDFSIENLQISKKILKIGDEFTFSFKLKVNNPDNVKLRLEYAIYYVKSNEKLSKKVFKITENIYEKQKEFNFNKKHSFKDLTTRKHYPGEHRIAIIVNGKECAESYFKLEKFKS